MLRSSSSTVSLSSISSSMHSLPARRVSLSAASRQWVRRAWTIHFCMGLCILFLGVWNNRWSRKYIPVNPELAGASCDKAFLNVMAPSSDDEGAIVCCEGFPVSSISGLCPSDSDSLPLAGRLSRFPDAWLLPLFPLLLRMIFTSYMAYTTTGRVFLDAALMPAFRRLGYYIVLLNIRGWVLYLAFNELEDMIVRPITEACWYRDWLREDQPECFGRVFDFSDHVVLYFGQILPIALVECIHSFEDPYWTEYCRGLRSQVDTAIARVLPVCLVGGMLYIYFITYLGVYKTASYFHTASEVLAGFGVSLLIHVPLCRLQCSQQWERTREFLFAVQENKPKARIRMVQP